MTFCERIDSELSRSRRCPTVGDTLGRPYLWTEETDPKEFHTEDPVDVLVGNPHKQFYVQRSGAETEPFSLRETHP